MIIGVSYPCDAKMYHIKCMWFRESYILWSSDSVLYLEEFLVEEYCTEDIDSVRHYV